MAVLILTTISTSPKGGGVGTQLEITSTGEYVYMKPLGPVPKDGLMIAAHDARLLAAVLAEWTEIGPEGA